MTEFEREKLDKMSTRDIKLMINAYEGNKGCSMGIRKSVLIEELNRRNEEEGVKEDGKN